MHVPDLAGEDEPTVRIRHPRPRAEPVEPPISYLKREEIDPSEAMAWLYCDPLTPVPVTKEEVRLGRSKWADMVLPHDSVSRTHAVLRALGEQIVIEDRSSYGTLINGEPITSRRLAPGDVIGIGPYMITIRASQDDQDESPATTRPFRTMATTSSAEAMQGRLDKVPLQETLQQVEFYKKTGTLKVFGDELDGTLVVYEGTPMYAELGGERDQEALFGMLQLERGNYSFLSRVEAGEATMSGVTLTGLMMEFNRLQDET
jgi:hypothetical protein